jgi:DNA repair photolyase
MDGLKPLYGGLLKIPAPLELSGNWCAHACPYCFANLNSPTRTLDTGSVSRLLADYQNRNTIEGYLLRDGYPVIVSNHIDPFSASNYRQMIPFMETMTELGIPYSVQTKGGKGWEKVLEFMPIGVWYVSISFSDDETRKAIEPSAPPLEHRYELLEALISKGHTVIVGCNPCEPDWLLDPIPFFDNLKEIGVFGTWMENLHINTKQKQVMPERDRKRLGEDLISDCLKKKHSDPYRKEFVEMCREYSRSIGLENYSIANGRYSNFFDAYKMYPKLFPVVQQFINRCATLNREFFTQREWVEFFTPLLPTFVTSQNYHYIDSNVRMCPEKALGFKVPKNPTFETILKCSLKSHNVPFHPVNKAAFSYAVDSNGNHLLDDVDKLPILCYGADGWTHTMIEYDDNEINEVDYVGIIRQ